MSTRIQALEGLDRLREAHVAALNAGDADAWVACFTPDAVQMPPNYPANVGAEKHPRLVRAGCSRPSARSSRCSPEEVQPAGTDWAFERGTYAITLTPRAGGDAMRDAGKYITLYQRQADGAWLMARDIWNSNNPLPGSS